MTDEHWTDERMRELLRASYVSPRFPVESVERRIAASVRTRSGRGSLLGHPTVRAVLAAAAVLVVFVAGAEYGRRTAAPVEVLTSDAGVATPLSIQSAGSEYVARLARFSAEAEQLTATERGEARQVALAILYAATLELLRESEDDELLATAAQLIFSRRQAERDSEHDGALWF